MNYLSLQFYHYVTALPDPHALAYASPLPSKPPGSDRVKAMLVSSACADLIL
jgi:hypothetical protein